MSIEAVVKRQRKETRRMKRLLRADQAALRQKAEEREMLMRKKQSLVAEAEQAAKDKMVADFMLFAEALEKNDTERAQKFDEEAMKNTILCMMEGGWGQNQNEGFASGSDNGGGEEA